VKSQLASQGIEMLVVWEVLKYELHHWPYQSGKQIHTCHFQVVEEVEL